MVVQKHREWKSNLSWVRSSGRYVGELRKRVGEKRVRGEGDPWPSEASGVITVTDTSSLFQNPSPLLPGHWACQPSLWSGGHRTEFSSIKCENVTSRPDPQILEP